MSRLGMPTSLIFNSQHVATRCIMVAKRVQHVAPNNVAICAFLKMLRSFQWPELANAGPTLLGYVKFGCCYRLALAGFLWLQNISS